MRLVALEAQQLSGRLINAQEDERRRIARELHDDLSQRLAVMSVQLDLLRRSRANPESDASIEQLVTAVKSLSSEIHALSYRLHPAKLDQLGLVTAARGWCRDMAAHSGLAIDYRAHDVPADLPREAALCLYRILQETTRNVVRHSGASAASVELFTQTDGLHLVVKDDGCGFDAGVARLGGLGLVSMRERVRFAGGRLVIDSRLAQGTRVEAIVPFEAAASGAETAERTEHVHEAT
jgi:signal transduction histidine kinase